MTAAGTGIAPLTNVRLFAELVERVCNRPAHLPGMATFHGHSGYGKTWSAIHTANKARAKYVEVGSSWTKKKLCMAIATELGLAPRGTIGDMVEKIVEGLAVAGAPLIIDEADHLAARGMIELVRELHDASGAPIILIGEEWLPDKLAKFERVHNRMLDWLPAQPATVQDCELLARHYCPDVAIDAGLLTRLHRASGGRLRRICVNLERVREAARTEGWEQADEAAWGKRDFFKGETPAVRRAA